MAITPSNAVVLINVAAGGKTIQLPSASANSGVFFFLRDSNGFCDSSRRITVTTTGSDRIDKYASTIFMSTPYESLTLVSDGLFGWYILNNYRSNVVQLAFQNFRSTGNIVTQNFSTASNVAFFSNAFRFINGAASANGAVWTRQKFPTSSFTGSFTFRYTPGDQADGLCWVFQNTSAGALGFGGGGLGYAWKIADVAQTVLNQMVSSVAVRFDIFGTVGAQSSTDFLSTGSIGTGLAASGDITGTFNFVNGQDYFVTLNYTKANVFSYTISNTSNGMVFSSNTNNVNVPALVGSNAWVGFTAGSGGSTCTPYITSFTFSAST